MRSFGDHGRALCVAIAVAVAASSSPSAQEKVEQLYQEAITRETALRADIDNRVAGAPAMPLLRRARILVSTYEDLARLFPRSAYGDNALWQGGMLAADVFFEFGEAEDRSAALRLLNAIPTSYPTSSLVKQVPPQITRLSNTPTRESGRTVAAAQRGRPASPGAGAASLPSTAPSRSSAPSPTPRLLPPATAPVSSVDAPPLGSVAAVPPSTVELSSPPPPPEPSPTATRVATLNDITREVVPGAVRVTLELDREVRFHDERLDGPPRVFVDLRGARPLDELKDVTLTYPDDVVRQVRTGRQPGGRVRVVLDVAGVHRHSIYTLYNPFRIIIEIERPDPIAAPLESAPPAAAAEAPPALVTPPAVALIDARPEAALPAPVPAKPNVSGRLSLSRQLGLAASRIVIDPGHGGHDPGAKVNGLTEADLVLDVALRLEKLLQKEPGVEVVLTRRGDDFVPLEERTAMANREEADLFLSIHANASDDSRIRGVETYFLSLAQTKQAEALAARENAASTQRISNLPSLVRSITMNEKVNESRDFAAQLQTAMLERLRRARKTSRNLGVKQAPFMVLVGAGMPSALTEISFITNRQEQTWLKTEAYRQQLAEALFSGIMRYQRSLKSATVAASSR